MSWSWLKLYRAEGTFTQRALEELESVPWTAPLVRAIERQGGICAENMSLLFEVRVAYELHRLGFAAEYEYHAGVGNSSVDFRILGQLEWLIEVVSLAESKSIEGATRSYGPLHELRLTSNAWDSPQSEEGEILLAGQKIAEKVFHNGKPIKFPTPEPTRVHVVLADMRVFLQGQSDIWDYKHIAHGAQGVPEDAVRYWQGRPIKGLFENTNPLRAARIFRERVHFIAFVAESVYTEGEISRVCILRANPHLLNDHQATELGQQFPLKSPISRSVLIP